MHSQPLLLLLLALLLFAAPTTPTPTPPPPPTPPSLLGRSIVSAHRASTHARSLIDDIFGGGNDNANNIHGYAPYNVTCPPNITWNRPATSLGTIETSYLSTRSPLLASAWSSHLASLPTSPPVPAPPRTPVVALALSGGGYRAMISGSGQAFAVNDTQGSVGDVAALATYVGGLSGGSWAVASWLANDGVRPETLVREVWNTDSNLVIPSDNKLSFYLDLIQQVGDKADQGFATQLTDYWALALSDHLFPEPYHTDQSPNLTITHVRSNPSVANASLPFPVIIAVEREPGELVIALNSTIWEFTLGEFGSWYWGSEKKTQGGFTNIQYLGTDLDNGTPTNETGGCVLGFSNLGFIAGTSATLFNQAFLSLNSSTADSIIVSAVQEVLQNIGEAENDVAVYPNSFHGWNEASNPVAGFRNLTLVDGGEANENVPLAPFLVPYRNVDAIIAFDNSADTSYAWPNGSSLHVSYQKAIDQERVYGITSRMPQVPSTNGFINGGYNTRPTFFGCNDTDTTLIVYVPNAPWSTYSNTTTFQLAYPTEQAAAIVDNGRRTLDLNGTVADWPTCLTCALMDRAATENGTARSSTCQKCFDTWCWKGDDNTTQPASYEPVLGVAPQFILDLTNSTGGEGVSYGSGSQRLDASYARWGGVLTVVIGMYVMLL